MACVLIIVGYILKNSRNSILAKGKDDGKARDTQQPAGKSKTISFNSDNHPKQQ